MMRGLWKRRAVVWTAMPVVVALVTGLARVSGANATTAGFLYLMTVLGLAAWGGWGPGVVSALAAALCFNYFFLPPLGTLTISHPSNWVALLSFLVVATFASHLVTTARRRAEEAQQRQREVEILYELCFGLFAAGHRPGVLGESAARTLQAIGAESGLLLLPDGEVVSAVGDQLVPGTAALAEVRGELRLVETDGTAYLPLEVGGLFNGILVARTPAVPRRVLESAGRLLALAIERERLLGEAAHLEAVEESEALKTALLRAVSHDLRTPLTAMRMEVESLGRHVADRPAAMASVEGLSREQERLARRIDNLLALARLEAGLARPHPEAVPPGSLFRAAQESLASLLAGRMLEVRIEPRCPDLWVDPSLALEIVVNLLENAARATPTDQTLELTAAGAVAGRVVVEVLDRGPGLPTDLRRATGDRRGGGLGLRIAESFARANGSTLSLADRPGGGTRARLELPAAPELAEEEG